MRCKDEGLNRPDWVESRLQGRREWRGQVSLGLAETIRQWHEVFPFAPRKTAVERAAGRVSEAARAAERSNSFASGLGSELEAILLSVEEDGIHPSSPRGRKMIWSAWNLFLSWSLDYERDCDCQNCSESFRPEIDRRFVNTFIDRYVRPPSSWRAAEKKLLRCPACNSQA